MAQRIRKHLLYIFSAVLLTRTVRGAFKPALTPDNYSPETTPWPKPNWFKNGTAATTIDASTIQVSIKFTDGGDSARSLLEDAVTRAKDAILHQSPQGPPLPRGMTSATESALGSLIISVASSSDVLGVETNETYSLSVTATDARIDAATVYGAMHALQSLCQLVEVADDGTTHQIRGIPWEMHDFPRFSHRAVLVDTSRHFLPVPTLLAFIDAMAMSKLNVLHWHLVDAQAFPFMSAATQLGRGAWAPDETYLPAQLAQVVAYARARAVRVMAEVDTPGHVLSWGVAYPDIVTPCQSPTRGWNNPPLNPATNETYTIVGKLLTELNAIFPDSLFHLGGDEVMYDCWNASDAIRSYMAKQGYGTNFALLQQEYETRLLAVAAKSLPQKSLVLYQEVFDEGVKIPSTLIVDIWKRASNHTVPKSPSTGEEITRVAQAGHRLIVANGPFGQWYLNDGFGNGLCQDGGCLYALWGDVYANEPTDGATLTTAQVKLVLGGEASLWGEEIDQHNIMSKAWPRASAFAERMWTQLPDNPPPQGDPQPQAPAASVKQMMVDEAAPRLARMVCKLAARGVDVSPIAPGSCRHWTHTARAAAGSSSSPPPPPPLYDVMGSIAVGTLENSLFLWNNQMYVLENMICSDPNHAGRWDPRFAGHSYARIRNLTDGTIIANVSQTIDHAFVSSFPDYEHGRLWLFGIDVNRCHGMSGSRSVDGFWSSDLVTWHSGTAIHNIATYNVEAAYVDTTPAGMPPHRYVMIVEPFDFLINNNTDGNLTGPGWVKVDSKQPHGIAIGGPSIRFSNGYYYVFTGGHNVFVWRSKDLQTWEPSTRGPLIYPTPNDANVAPYAGFPAVAAAEGFGPMHDHWTYWDHNSNDGDVCCMHPNASGSWLVWGASTQGGKPTPPVTHGSTNALGRNATTPLPRLLEAYFA
eukprot:m.31478 g.31478  ORF g.31478 m.31478 type:complete len:923 (-) comp13977_c0_seq1:581-3349(-)